MDEDGEKMADIKQRVRQGDYRVDTRAVADAVLRRLRDVTSARARYAPPAAPGLSTRAVITLNAHTQSVRRVHP